MAESAYITAKMQKKEKKWDGGPIMILFTFYGEWSYSCHGKKTARLYCKKIYARKCCWERDDAIRLADARDSRS